MFAIIALQQNSFAQKVFLPHYTTKHGLPSNNCFFTLQDKKGFLWIATDAGVSRFDGAVFENFSVDNGLPDNQILQLHEDSKGRIWFLALNGQLSFFKNGRIYNQYNFEPLKQLNFNGVIVSFFEDSWGRLWFGTNNDVIGLWDGQKTLKIRPENETHKYQNSFIYEDKSKRIWALNSSGNFIFKAHNFVETPVKAIPQSYKTIQRYQNQKLYFIDKDGLKIMDGESTNLRLALNNLKISNLGYIYASENELWLSHNDGVMIIDNSGKTKRLLSGVSVSQAIKDRDGNMWFTTRNGIYKLPQLKDQLHIYQPSNTSYNLKSIVKDKYNRLWLGATNGNIHLLNLDTKKTETIRLPDVDKFNVIKQLVFDQQKDKIFFASDYGLGSVSASYPKLKNFHFLRETSNHVFVVKNFTIDTTSKLTLSLSSGVVILNDREQLEFSSLKYKEQKDFFKDRSYRVYYDRDQNLWFSNISGLSAFTHYKLEKHYLKYPLLTKRINDIKQLPDGAMAMATDGYGIFIFKNGKITHTITQKNGLNNNIINKLFVKNNYLWAISNTGINRIAINSGNLKISSFDDVNGILSDDLNDLYISQDTAYFATNNGLLYFAYNQSLQNTPSPLVYITAISNHNKQLDLLQKTIVLKPNNQNLNITYSAIDFKNRNITYRYRLKNKASWIQTKNRTLELSSLEPGEYTFEVSAKSQNSDWSKPASIKLVLQNQFYQTWWFTGLSLAIGGFLIYSVTVNITKRQKNKEQERLLLKNKILMLEQKALQAMMNPHFVFNVMNSIQHYINTKNTASANKVLTGFARLIRKNLEICTQSYITLEEEINYLNLYLNLEKNRFGDQLQYQINVADNIDREETLIPSMLLQPYIENAIWHGIMPKEEGGTVKISITEDEEETLLIEIIDDGIGIDNALKQKKDGHQSKGMTLTRERINLLNKIEAKPIHLSIRQNGKTGTLVSIFIPRNG